MVNIIITIDNNIIISSSTVVDAGWHDESVYTKPELPAVKGVMYFTILNIIIISSKVN